jgi:hypothetical protein
MNCKHCFIKLIKEQSINAGVCAGCRRTGRPSQVHCKSSHCECDTEARLACDERLNKPPAAPDMRLYNAQITGPSHRTTEDWEVIRDHAGISIRKALKAGIAIPQVHVAVHTDAVQRLAAMPCTVDKAELARLRLIDEEAKELVQELTRTGALGSHIGRSLPYLTRLFRGRDMRGWRAL